jgi:hypothetical protein
MLLIIKFERFHCYITFMMEYIVNKDIIKWDFDFYLLVSNHIYNKNHADIFLIFFICWLVCETKNTLPSFNRLFTKQFVRKSFF